MLKAEEEGKSTALAEQRLAQHQLREDEARNATALVEQRERLFLKQELENERLRTAEERKDSRLQDELTRTRLIEDREWAQQLVMTNSWQEHQRHMQMQTQQQASMLAMAVHSTRSTACASTLVLPNLAAAESTPCVAPNLLPNIAAIAGAKVSSSTKRTETQQLEVITAQKELLFLQIKLAQLTAENNRKSCEKKTANVDDEDEEDSRGEEYGDVAHEE
mmetsp:Transcript_23637/g.32360  ORF Transcript_23637/g.32360 Transcript_23637/m.32360 type:complete len:220 (+) Transcript_23637:888-1547(+)